MENNYDFVVVGGGIAGVAVGAELAKRGSVLILEREALLAYHTTGRSAAISMESYGNALIRQLTCASRDFYEAPPTELTDQALCHPRGALIVTDEARWEQLKRRYSFVRKQVPSACWFDRKAIHEMVHFLADRWVGGIYEPSAFDLDVQAIHTAFVRGLRQRGGRVKLNSELRQAEYRCGVWHIQTATDMIQAGCIVNASGAWADMTAQMCGITPLGIKPLLRTVVTVDPEQNVDNCPYVGTVDEQIFIKPDVGRLMVSPCDETPSDPCDALPDEMGVAIAMDRLEKTTTLRPRRVLNRWAGLRVFAPDRSPVIGVDPSSERFVWCAALGGYGIQTAPAMARLSAALACQEPLPTDLGLMTADEIAPARLLTLSTQNVVAVAELR